MKNFCTSLTSVNFIKKSKEKKTSIAPGPAECVGELSVHVLKPALEQL